VIDRATDGTCETGESASSCATNCGGGPNVECGDGVCDPSEVTSCADDCTDPVTLTA